MVTMPLSLDPLSMAVHIMAHTAGLGPHPDETDWYTCSCCRQATAKGHVIHARLECQSHPPLPICEACLAQYGGVKAVRRALIRAFSTSYAIWVGEGEDPGEYPFIELGDQLPRA